MKYKIKIETFETGRKEYTAYVGSKFWGITIWKGIGWNGNTLSLIDIQDNSREDALSRIDKHYAGNSKTKSITFEYITK